MLGSMHASGRGEAANVVPHKSTHCPLHITHVLLHATDADSGVHVCGDKTQVAKIALTMPMH